MLLTRARVPCLSKHIAPNRICQQRARLPDQFTIAAKLEHLLARQEVLVQVGCFFGEQHAAGSRHFEHARLDLPATPMPGFAEIQTHDRISRDQWNVFRRHRPVRPAVAETFNRNAGLTQRGDPGSSGAVGGPNKAHRVTAFTCRLGCHQPPRACRPLGRMQVDNAIARIPFQRIRAGGGIQIEVRRNQAGEFPVFPGVVSRPIDDPTTRLAHQRNALKPYLGHHEHGEHHLGPHGLDLTQERTVQAGEIWVAGAIKGFKK